MRRSLVFILCFITVGQVLANQPNAEESHKVKQVKGRMTLFIDEIESLLANVSFAKERQLINAEQSLKGIDIKWNVYCNAHQDVISSEESLMEVVANYGESKQLLEDSIQSQLHKLDSYSRFENAEKFFISQKAPYKKWYDEAVEYTLLKQTSALLEKLKTKEQLLFNDLTAKYEEARNISEEFPALKKRMENIENEYIEIKGFSEKIQAAEYKPFLDRIKDYLYSFAAVAMLLMFANMVHAKIQAFKQMHKSAKEYKELLMKSEEGTPTI